MKMLLIFALFVCSPWIARAQQSPTQNPYTSPQDVAAGGRMFRSHCAKCHGMDGSGGLGTDLTRGRFRHGGSDKEIFDNIYEGIPGTEMPSVFFQGKQLWQLVAFVRSLSQTSPPPARGSAVRGETLFRGKGGCLQCHIANGEGGRLGPDLSNIGSRRSLAHLRASVVSPHEKVLPQHWRMNIVTRDGKRVLGRRLNEDTLSFQILDSDDNLVSFLKREIEKHEFDKTSAMPAYAEAFQNAELDDLIAYLAALRKKETP